MQILFLQGSCVLWAGDWVANYSDQTYLGGVTVSMQVYFGLIAVTIFKSSAHSYNGCFNPGLEPCT